MKKTHLLIAAVLLFLLGCKTNYDYPPNPAAPAVPEGPIEGLTCDETDKKEFDIAIGADAKFYVYEITNAGRCPVNVRVHARPAGGGVRGAKLSEEKIDTGKHFVFADDIPRGNAGNVLHFEVYCDTRPAGNCLPVVKVRLCNETDEETPANPTFSVSNVPNTIIPGTGTANKCIAGPLELLTIKNESGREHRISFTIVSTCQCPEFHVDPVPGAQVGPNGNRQVQNFRIRGGRTVTFTGRCAGNPAPGDCSGHITNITVRPKP